MKVSSNEEKKLQLFSLTHFFYLFISFAVDSVNKTSLFLFFIENHRTQTSYEDALILKLFGFQFVNSYTSLFYIAFFRQVQL